MKKIAIITMNHGYNYGNKLQNYAMKKIYNKMGFEVDTISFQPLKSNITSSTKISLIKKITNKIIRNIYSKREESRIAKFKEFNKINLNMTDEIYNSSNYYKINTDAYDYFSVGSDQVWNSYFWDFSKFYLLDFVNEENKKLAYAASFGVDDINNEYIESFKENLARFKSISVREEKGREIIKELIGKDVPVVLDPTLMLDKEEWSNFAKKPDYYNYEKYVFTYFLGEMIPERKNMIKKFAKEKGLKIISLNDIKAKYYDCNPNEMVYLIKNADIILTDSFHACVFSIIFEKEFYVFERISNGKNMNSRIETLLSILNIRRMTDKNLNEKCNYNYKEINKLLEENRKNSFDYLKGVIEENDKNI